VPFLGEVPIFKEIREGGDKGVPVVVSKANAAAGAAFVDIAKALMSRK
jgi:ATP-binding protein involved in chromosome partitioning